MLCVLCFRWDLWMFFFKHRGRFSEQKTIRNGSTKVFWTPDQSFFGHLTKNLALRPFCSSLFSSVPEKPHVDPKKHCFWDGMNLGHWVYVGFLPRLNITAINPEGLMPRLLLGVQKNIILKILGPAVLDGRPKSPFPGMKILRRVHVTFFAFFPTAKS